MTRILVVDDDEDIRNLFLHYLTPEGYEIVCVGNGLAALEALKFSSFDMVISDILMPELNGIDLTRKIVELYPALKILVCSEGGTSDAKEIVAAIVMSKAVNEGAVQALMKPFSRNELVEIVKNILANKNLAA